MHRSSQSDAGGEGEPVLDLRDALGSVYSRPVSAGSLRRAKRFQAREGLTDAELERWIRTGDAT